MFDSEQVAARTSRRSWVSVATVALAVFAVTTTEMTPMGLLPAIARDLDVSEGRVGLSVTLYGLLAGLFAPIVTVATGRVDRRTLLSVILAVFTVGNALSAAARSYLTFMVSRFASGLIHGLMWAIVAGVAIRLVCDRDAVRATAAAFAGISSALVLGVPLGAFIGSTLGWRSAFAVLSLLCAATFVLVRIVLPTMPSERSFTFTDIRSLLGSRALRGVLFISATVVIGNYTAYAYVAPFLRQERGISARLIGSYLLCYGLAGIIGNLTSGALLSRSRTGRLLLAGLTVVLAATLLLIALAHTWVLLAALLALWGSSYSALPVVLQTLVLRATKDGPGEATTSIYVLVFNCSIAAGALVGGVAIDAGGPNLPMLIGVLFCTLGVAAIGVVGRTSTA